MSLPKRINRGAEKKIPKTFDVADRLDIMAKHEYFITLKDHKDHEEDHRTKIYRLRNPTKSQLGKIRRQILQKINKTLRFELNMNQW